MKKIKLLSVFFAFVVIFFAGCSYNKEEILYPGGSTCDTTATSTFNAVVLPILNTNCNNSCHGGSAAAGAGINLDTYAGVKAQVNNGKLLGSITHASGFSPMPKNGSKLSACNIAKINRWITAGALNN